MPWSSHHLKIWRSQHDTQRRHHQFIATNDLAAPQLELAERILNSPPPVRRHHEMQTFNFGKRTSLMELRPGISSGLRRSESEHYDRSEMHDYMMEHCDRLFGPLRRPKSKAVPSDFLRKSLDDQRAARSGRD